MPWFKKKPQHYAAMFTLFFLVWAAAMEIGLRMMGFEGVALYEAAPDGFYRMRPGTSFMDGGQTNLLGLRAGAQGRRIDKLPARGRAVADTWVLRK